MNLLNFCQRAGLGAAAAGMAGYAALALWLPAPARPAAPPDALPTRVAAAPAGLASAAASDSTLRPQPDALPRPARRALEPRVTRPARSITTATPPHPEHARPAGHALRTAETAEQIYPPAAPPAGRAWASRRVY